MHEYAITFFTLLAEADKLDTYQKRWDLAASAYPNMEAEDQQRLRDSLKLPDDVLDDILADEQYDDISKLKDIFKD